MTIETDEGTLPGEDSGYYYFGVLIRSTSASREKGGVLGAEYVCPIPNDRVMLASFLSPITEKCPWRFSYLQQLRVPFTAAELADVDVVIVQQFQV